MPMKKSTANKRIAAAKRKAKLAERRIMAEYRMSQRAAKARSKLAGKRKRK